MNMQRMEKGKVVPIPLGCWRHIDPSILSRPGKLQALLGDLPLQLSALLYSWLGRPRLPIDPS